MKSFHDLNPAAISRFLIETNQRWTTKRSAFRCTTWCFHFDRTRTNPAACHLAATLLHTFFNRKDSVVYSFHEFKERTIPFFNHLAPTLSNNAFKRTSSTHVDHAEHILTFSIFNSTLLHRASSCFFLATRNASNSCCNEFNSFKCCCVLTNCTYATQDLQALDISRFFTDATQHLTISLSSCRCIMYAFH